MVRELLRRRGFRLLFLGQAVSSLGDWMGTLALMYFVLELSGSTTAVGGVLALRLLPMAVGAPVAARTVTRWSRRRVMLSADLIRAGMAVLLPLIPWLGWVYSWAFGIEVVGLAFLPARDASIPTLVGGTDERDRGARLSLANGLIMGGYYGMIPLGAGALGLALVVSEQLGLGGHWRYVVVFWADAVTYLVSYAAVRSIAGLDHRAAQGPDEAGGRRSGERLSTAFRIPVVRAVLPGLVVVALGLGALFSLGVVFVRDDLRAGPVQFGALVALFGVGAVTGLAIVRRIPQGMLISRVRAAAAGQGAVISAMGVFASIPWAFLGAVMFGAATTVALVSAVTYLQENLAGVHRDLALTAFHAVLRLGLALAALVSGAAADAVGRGADLGPAGTIAPARLVLMLSGVVVALGSLFVRSPGRVPGPPRTGRLRRRVARR
jgi:MFS family permease